MKCLKNKSRKYDYFVCIKYLEIYSFKVNYELNIKNTEYLF